MSEILRLWIINIKASRLSKPYLNLTYHHRFNLLNEERLRLQYDYKNKAERQSKEMVELRDELDKLKYSLNEK